MAEINWTEEALEDLRSIEDYISIDSEFYAVRFVDKLIKRVDGLRNHTHLGRVVPEFNSQEIRELIEQPYRIVYKLASDSQVFIVRIYHQARQLK
jgi:addiction module RelE/StbE family toxin